MATKNKQRELPNDWLVDQIKASQSPNYLGKQKVVGRLLQDFAAHVLSADVFDREDVDQRAKYVARILLGYDDDFPGPKWNTPGQIDEHVAKQEGIESDVPEERVAGGLINMLVELKELANTVHEQQAIKEQWRDAVHMIITRYVTMFMGMPLTE